MAHATCTLYQKKTTMKQLRIKSKMVKTAIIGFMEMLESIRHKVEKLKEVIFTSGQNREVWNIVPILKK